MAAAIAGAAAMDAIPAPPAWTPPIVSQTLKDIGTMITDSALQLAAREVTGKAMQFDYGEQVFYNVHNEIGGTAPTACCVVAITGIETDEQAKAFGYPIGTVMYTVEFGDGTDKFVPESDLGKSGTA